MNWNIGMVEYWNVGRKNQVHYSRVPAFHDSSS
jgi:hypothetical protein